MNICLLGNSHSACLKLAWNELSTNYEMHKITFYASRGSNLSLLLNDGKKLYSDLPQLSSQLAYTSGRENYINTTEYDVFLVCGLGFLCSPVSAGVSEQVFSVTCNDQLNNSAAIKLINTIKKTGDKPIYLMHNPLLDERAKSNLIENYYPYHQHFGKSMLAADLINIKLVPQPADSIIMNNFTKVLYSIGSERLNLGDLTEGSKHGLHDNSHMNLEFGKIWLKEFINLL